MNTTLETIRESIATRLQVARRLEIDALNDINHERRVIKRCRINSYESQERDARSRLSCHYADLHEARGKIDALTQCLAAFPFE